MKTARLGIVLGSISAAFVGCAGPRMVPPAGLDGAQVLETKDRKRASGMFVNESFQLGDFRVTDVNRKSVRNSGFTVARFNSTKTTTGYRYKFAKADKIWEGACAFNRQSKGLSLNVGDFSKSRFELACDCKDGAQEARLDLKSEGETLAGTLNAGGSAYAVTPVGETDKKTFGAGPAGYRVDDPDGPRGAVEVLHPGRMWLNGSLREEERAPTACLLAGLMLYVEPKED